GAEHRQDLGELPLTAELVLSLGTTVGVAALFVTALGPATRLNLRLRPRLFFPAGVGERVRSLAAAALLPLVAMQLCLLFSVVLANWGGGAGASVLYTYAWALFTLPYGVIAVPIATSAFTALAVTHTEQDRVGFASLVSGSARACVVATAIVGTALASAAGPVARVFAEQDPGALEWALLAYAPGVIGFGLIALLSRVLYASSHEVRAALAQTVGWLVGMGGAAVSVWVQPSGRWGCRAPLVCPWPRSCCVWVWSAYMVLWHWPGWAVRWRPRHWRVGSAGRWAEQWPRPCRSTVLWPRSVLRLWPGRRGQWSSPPPWRWWIG